MNLIIKIVYIPKSYKQIGQRMLYESVIVSILHTSLNSVLSIVAIKNKDERNAYTQHWKDIEGAISDRQ